jgi:hypothetical protein
LRASSIVGSVSAIALNSVDRDVRAAIAHSHLRALAGAQIRGARPDAAVRTHDDRVPAPEYVERRERVELTLRMCEALATRWDETRGRAIECAAILIEALA